MDDNKAMTVDGLSFTVKREHLAEDGIRVIDEIDLHSLSVDLSKVTHAIPGQRRSTVWRRPRVSAVDELITWLRAQLEADEQEINRHPIDGMPQLYSDDEREGEGYFATGESNYPCNSMLTVNKRFALAQVEANRRILDEFSWEAGETRAVMYLAQPYAGRDGWREEWAA